MWMFLVIAGFLALSGLGQLAESWSKRAELRKRAMDQREADIGHQAEGVKRARAAHSRRVSEDRAALAQLAQERALGFPWLAKAYAEYFALQDMRTAEHLESKRHPAKKAAEVVRETAKKRREAERRFRVVRDRLRYYESLFPWLTDFVTEDVDGLLASLEIPRGRTEGEAEGPEQSDPVRRWLSPEEYAALPTVEKNQLALDRWASSTKSNWEIGRDYERYVGYLNERQGYQVTYSGALQGLEDRGRDLIARGSGDVRIIQCKYWAREKTIHEKHIFQLYGTCIEFLVKERNAGGTGVPGAVPLGSLPRYGIEPWFVTSTTLSDVARQVAEILGVTVVESEPLKPYPIIKCNVSRRGRERIYHLPFDQQYDKVVIESERGECYVASVGEAEALGFRRAYRWHGEASGADG